MEIAGTWRESNTKTTPDSLLIVLRGFGGAIYHLLFGTRQWPPTQTSLNGIELATVLAALVLALDIARILCRSIPRLRGYQSQPLLILILSLVVYCVCMLYAALVTAIAFDTRYFVPILPLILVTAGIVLSFVLTQAHSSSFDTRVAYSATCLFVAGYLATNLNCVLQSPPRNESEVIAEALSRPMKNGNRLRGWIENTIPRDSVLVAEDGQATGYVLNRPTVSLIAQRYTQVRWSENQVRDVMRSFGADYLVVYLTLDSSSVPDQLESPFMQSIVHGKIPNWLLPVAENSAARVLRRNRARYE